MCDVGGGGGIRGPSLGCKNELYTETPLGVASLPLASVGVTEHR